MTYEEAIHYLEAANVFGIQLGLGRIQNLLERLGNPQNKYKTIHVTGTNGKGSVTAMIASALTEAGFKTGRYTSPHLESYTERIHIDHHDISEDDFAAAVAVVKDAVTAMVADGGEGPTEFELITAAAFWYRCRLCRHRSRTGGTPRFDERHRSGRIGHHQRGYGPHEILRQYD